MVNEYSISVVLATRNRAESLKHFLCEMQKQRDAPPFDVVVANNASADQTAEILAQPWAGLTVRSVYEEFPGKGRALNSALKMAEGDLIVFTDDDVTPQSDWLAQMAKVAADFPSHKVFGGHIQVNQEAVPSWILRSFNLMGLLTSAHDKGDSPVTYGYAEYPFGPNMAVRRRFLAEDVGLYPEDMGPGTKQPVGDETGFFLRISPPDAKDRLFVPSARVLHEVEPENVAFGTALRRCYQAGIAHGRLRLPAVARGALPEDQSSSTPAAIIQRLRSTRSVRELACITSRYLGYRQGCRQGPA